MWEVSAPHESGLLSGTPGATLGLTPQGRSLRAGQWGWALGLHGGRGFLVRPMGSCLWPWWRGRGAGTLLADLGHPSPAQLVYLLSFLEFLCSQVPRAACQSGSPRAGLREASAVEAATPWPGLTVLGPWSRWPSSREGGPHRGYPAHTLPWN